MMSSSPSATVTDDAGLAGVPRVVPGGGPYGGDLELEEPLVTGGKRLVSENYRCTVTIGDMPGQMPGLQSETYLVRLGVGPRANP